ncbi:5'-3' exoribonuclease 2-like [Saccoglossus kowalevskii]
MREAEAGIERRSADEFGFDYNSLCPGTDFMSRLHVHLRAYIADRIRTQPRWVGIKVILSDASVPGEGEHKIMEIIRSQRATPTHDINTRHCIHGNDADLIILGLATHEPNFSIIKEEIPCCDWCKKKGHTVRDCRIAPRHARENIQVSYPYQPSALGINVLGINVVIIAVTTVYRAIDDWVFLCSLLGNDFLPKLPSLNVRENALHRLVGIYKTAVTHTMRYLTDNGIVNLHMLQMILTELGKEEDVIFRERRQRNEWVSSRNNRYEQK